MSSGLDNPTSTNSSWTATSGSSPLLVYAVEQKINLCTDHICFILANWQLEISETEKNLSRPSRENIHEKICELF